MFRKIVGAPAQLLLSLACCFSLSAFRLPGLFAQSKPAEQKHPQPFSHNKCDWLPGGTFFDEGYTNELLGIAYKVPDSWRVDSKYLEAVNWTTPPPPRPADPDNARVYDSAMRTKGCTLVAMSRSSSPTASSRYSRVEIDLSYDPDEKGEITTKDALQFALMLYKKNPALKAISEIQEVQLAGMRFFQLDTELLAQDGRTHYFHRSLVAPAVNHLALTVRITATSLEDVGSSTETLNSLQIDRTRFKLVLEGQVSNPSTHE